MARQTYAVLVAASYFWVYSLDASIKDRLGFLARVKNEVTELFSFLHTLEEEKGKKLIIVPFVDDLDRVMGGNGERVTKVLEAVLDYALNLSPALRDTITRDVAQNVSKYEPRLPRPFLGFKSDSSLREGSVQPKAAYLLQPPKAPQE